MYIEEILAGESKHIEFKETLPEKNIHYMKSVVAFANGSGGKLIFGIADQTHEIVGISKDRLFPMMDAIANAISDSCAPAILPDISLQTIGNKTIISVEVAEGRQRPYYIKALGKENGVYVRVAGTTRPADESMVKELSFEGSRRCFDQTICTGFRVTDADIDELCSALKEQAVKNVPAEADKAAIKKVSRQQLRSWGILVEQNGKDYPTNAYSILTGIGPLHAAIQCGVFKGTTREIFVDRREYSGPIWKQIEDAFQFVLRSIHLGASLSGIYRRDHYEIPPEAIRELLINAAVHRSYLDHGNIYVALYDNRLEITSPGKLPMGQTLERMKEGYSRLRNEALAHAFSYMNLMEHWGSGIPRIIGKVRAADLPEPEFIGGEVDLRVNIYRRPVQTTRTVCIAEEHPELYLKSNGSLPESCQKLPYNAGNCHKVPASAGSHRKLPGSYCNLPESRQEQRIYEYAAKHTAISAAQAAELLGVKPRRARDILHKMAEAHWLRKNGASRTTVYIINQ